MSAETPDSGDPVRPLALELLVEVDRGGWVDRLLNARRVDRLVPRDRGFLQHLVLTTLRWQGAIDIHWRPCVDRHAGRVDPLVRAAIRIAIAEVALLGRPVPVAVSASVDAVRRRGGIGRARFVNAVLRRALRSGAPRLDPAATIPRWLHARWSRRFGEPRALALVRAVNRPARPFVLADPAAGGRDALRAELALAGVVAEPSPLHPRGLQVLSGAPQRTDAFLRGAAILIDGGSALVAAIARPVDDAPVADLAAAPGGKLSALCHDARGPVVALELVPERARRLRQTLSRRRATRSVIVVRGDARLPPLAASRFGLVLLDAPCSGTGTLRRRPDRRWRICEDDLIGTVGMQREMLDAAASLVVPGGRLVYSVCSLEPEEGLEQILGFLSRRPEFVVEDPRPLLAREARRLVDSDSLVLATRPDEGVTDGFVAARLRRLR